MNTDSKGEVKIFGAGDIKLRKPKTFYIGLVASDKTTLYRQLNENKRHKSNKPYQLQ